MEVFNKVCVITGSAQGLGKAFAVRLLSVGARVCISDLKQEAGEKTLDEVREKFGKDKVCFVACNVTVEEEFNNLLDKAQEFFNVDCVDILVNNAGINTNLGWRKCMEVNIMAVMMGTEIAMERMRNSPNKGQIINVASMAGFGPGLNEEMVGYTVSKTGVVALTRTMAEAVGKHGVVTKCICPAWTDTEIVSSVAPNEEMKRNIKDSGGMMTPEFVAEGFYRLVTQCSNGSAMAVMKDVPYTLIPDYNYFPMIAALVTMARMMDKVIAPQVVTTRHHILGFSLLIIFIAIVIAIIF